MAEHNIVLEAIRDERDPPVESRNVVERGTRGPFKWHPLSALIFL